MKYVCRVYIYENISERRASRASDHNLAFSNVVVVAVSGGLADYNVLSRDDWSGENRRDLN